LLFSAVLFFLCLGLIANSQIQTPRNVSIINNCGGYYEYLPQGYNSNDTQTYPLIIFVHGIGELGNGTTDLPNILNCWTALPRLIANGGFPTSFTVGGQNFSFIVISPQFKIWPTSGDVNAVVDYAIQNYKVNQSRIYVTGLSMGGGAVWDFAAAYPTKAAAIVPVCGASYPDLTRGKIIANAKLPVWATHNLNDYTVSSSNTIGWVNNINQNGGNAISTIWPYTGHDAWSTTYSPTFTQNGVNIYEWMLQHQKGSSSSNQAPVANAGADQTITLPQNSVTLSGSGTDADGTIASYQWSQVSGPSQAGITSASSAQSSITALVQGTYTFRLTVTDNTGTTATDDVVVTVNAAANQAPVANAGTDQTITLPQNSVTLSGSGTDADGTIASYQWSQVSGPSKTGFTSSSSTIAINNLVEGLYVFRLEIIDDKGAVAIDDVVIVVKPDPRTKSTAAIYPNPVSDILNVRIDAVTLQSNSSIRIFNSSGSLVYSEEFMRTYSRYIKTIDVSSLLKGVYFITITADINTNISLSFVKQ
jgi:dienelactone hydrolase